MVRTDYRFIYSASTFSSQVDQLRSELMQERSARHDLEMDKSAIERQVLLNTKTRARAHTQSEHFAKNPLLIHILHFS